MEKYKQQNLFDRQFKLWTKDRFAFGASLLRGSHPKKKRLFRPELPLHVVLKSSQARGKASLLLHNVAITRILKEQAQKHFVILKSAANAGNHLHLLLEAPSREYLSAFLKAIAGRIAEYVYQGKGFWDARPFSRIVGRGCDERNVARYICINSSESMGAKRTDLRGMYAQIQSALDAGRLAMSPSLQAVGFS